MVVPEERYEPCGKRQSAYKLRFSLRSAKPVSGLQASSGLHLRYHPTWKRGIARCELELPLAKAIYCGAVSRRSPSRDQVGVSVVVTRHVRSGPAVVRRRRTDAERGHCRRRRWQNGLCLRRRPSLLSGGCRETASRRARFSSCSSALLFHARISGRRSDFPAPQAASVESSRRTGRDGGGRLAGRSGPRQVRGMRTTGMRCGCRRRRRLTGANERAWRERQRASVGLSACRGGRMMVTGMRAERDC